MHNAVTLALLAPASNQDFTLTTHTSLRLGSFVTETAMQLRLRRTLRHATPAGGFVFDLVT